MGRRTNYHFNRLGNDHGEIRFGHIHQDNNISGVMLRTGEDGGRHYMTMDSSGDIEQGRKGSTINVCPGSFAVTAGRDVAKDIPAIYQLAENGDILIGAPNGRVTIWAQNIELIASGPDGKNGVITIDANEKVIVKAPTIDINSKVSTKIFSEKTVDVIGKAILNIYGGLVDCADGATKLKGSKGGSTNEERNKK